jgi:aryl-alcohol dehydrogenase-like predicted oxidoreductase
MQYSRLGLTDFQVSRICFGCSGIGGYDYGPTDDKISIAAVRRAVELGVNFFDTADVYGLGRSERVLREALGAQCSELVVTTKVGVRWDESGNTRRDLSPEWITQALEVSLRRLKLEAITLYQIHWPDPNTPLEDTLAILLRLQEAGKIVHVGCCNVDQRFISRAQNVLRLETVQLPFSLIDTRHKSVFETCATDYSMSGLCYNVLAHGLFGGRYNLTSTFAKTDLRRRVRDFQGERFAENLAYLRQLQLYANAIGRTPAQVAIQWVLRSGYITSAIVGMKTPGQVDANILAIEGAELSTTWANSVPLPDFHEEVPQTSGKQSVFLK